MIDIEDLEKLFDNLHFDDNKDNRKENNSKTNKMAQFQAQFLEVIPKFKGEPAELAN